MVVNSFSKKSSKDLILSVPQQVWDDVAAELLRQNGGVATVDFSMVPELAAIHCNSFSVARNALKIVAESVDEQPIEIIPKDADSAHATGYHSAGSGNSMSRYNLYREGFVFSDGSMLSMSGSLDFEVAMTSLFDSLHETANQVLAGLERQMGLPQNWFQDNFGPTDTASQWHVKRYVEHPENDCSENRAEQMEEKKETEAKVILPMHTDPSLISVILHDAEGSNASGMGLQYYALTPSGERIWKDTPKHGHAVATIFIGSVLSHITGNTCSSVRHRVVKIPGVVDRMAATLFVRPQGSSLLQVPPSPILDQIELKKNITFEAWNTRVSKNYSKKKGKKK